jgi:polynucleotide 5'-kinase involved in rRNA processing
MVGNKNTGKSTISRYISNRLLSKYGKVAYFECDVGQPEFTPPGLISLNEITTPLLGPPFTHHQTPFHSIFYGATSPQQEPDSYLQGLTELLQIYKTNLSNLPMVVNTCGWTKGVGYDLLQHFISLLNPTDIIQLESPETRTLYLPDLLQQNIINSLIIPAVSDLELQKIKINAHDSRSLNMISYFLKEGGRWDFNCPLSKRLPYKVSFSSVKIKFMNEEVLFD